MNERIASTERFDYKCDSLRTTLRIPALPGRTLGKVCAAPGDQARGRKGGEHVGGRAKNVDVACETRASSLSPLLVLFHCKITVTFSEFVYN